LTRGEDVDKRHDRKVKNKNTEDLEIKINARQNNHHTARLEPLGPNGKRREN
jgi:hypothetical protein